MSTDRHGNSSSTSREDNALFLDIVQEAPLFGHRKSRSIFGAIVYCALLASTAGYAVLAAGAPYIFRPIKHLVPSLLCSCDVVLLILTGIFQQYFVSQVQKIRLQGYYSFSQKLKHIVRLPFAITAYGTATMLLVMVWKPYISFLSVSTLLRINMLAEAICAASFMSVYIGYLHQYNSLNSEPDILKSLYSPLQHSSPLEGLRYHDGSRLSDQQMALLQYQRENLHFLSEEVLRLQECLSKYERSDDGSTPQVDLAHLLAAREQELRTLSAEYVEENEKTEGYLGEWSARAAKLERALEGERISNLELQKNFSTSRSQSHVSTETSFDSNNRMTKRNWNRYIGAYSMKAFSRNNVAKVKNQGLQRLNLKIREKSDEMDEKAGQNVQNITFGPSIKKEQASFQVKILEMALAGKGRLGGVLLQQGNLMPTAVEKLGNVGTAKQLRKCQTCKTAVPQQGKLSDRKAYTRQKHTTVNATEDFLVGSDDGHEELLAAASAVINPTKCFPVHFWRQMEPFFGFISNVDIAHLKQQGSIVYAALSATQVHSDPNNCSTVPNGYGLFDHEREVGHAAETRTSELLPDQLVHEEREIPLYKILLAAIISEEDCTCGNGDLEFDAYGVGFELDEELGSNCVNHLDNFHFSGHAAFNGYKVTGKPDHVETDIDTSGIPNMSINSNFRHTVNGVLSDHALVPGMVCSKFQYDNMKIEEKLSLEVHSLGIFPEPLMDDEGICGYISKLEENHHGQVSKKKGLLDKLLKHASEIKELQEKEFEQCAHDKLVTMAYEKHMTCWGPNAGGGKGSSNKMAKQAALAFVKRTLDQCHKFEVTGNSCFSEPLFRDMFLSGTAHLSGSQSVDTPTNDESAKLYGNTSTRSLEARVSASMGSQPSPQTLPLGNEDSYISNPSDLFPPFNHLSEQITGKEDMLSNRVKKRELLLDDVGCTVGSPSSAPSVIGGSLLSITKGKRSERDREGKGHIREILSRNGTNKIDRPTFSNAKGERKTKTKPKQKTTQLSVSVNGLAGKILEQPKTTLPSEARSSENNTNSKAKENDGFVLDALDDAVDLSNLQLPGIDDNQGQDLGSWLNIDDDGLQEHGDIDFMGLEIPMDDLADLNMMV
ncbi:hypothetical protein NC653_039482 [Populus alba x Populus x berolinensis]|uniref:Uncharacterized protein n=1 Tax=Populus alba x Populus x berolinensis TaxID=444605 RepID=A0AAD6LBA3_9ROSI|nr:hypothetical protein NC653_039482 [Populus alba x Populus x berolinensis]